MAESVKYRRHYSLADSTHMYTVGSRQWSLPENFDMITTTLGAAIALLILIPAFAVFATLALMEL